MRPTERKMSRWLRATGVLYGLGAVDFLARPAASTEALGRAAGQPLEREEPGLYHSLASAYMATIAALALSASMEPRERSALVPPLLVAKAASSGALLYRYSATKKKGYAVGAALDAVLLGVTAGLYASVRDR